MRWTNDQLLDALNRYQREAEAAGLRPSSVRSYVDFSRLFLRWRAGDYRPRDASGPARQRSSAPVTAEELATELEAYGAELRAAHLRPRAVQTYLDHSSQFVRWLDGQFVPGSHLGLAARDRVGSPSRPADLSWASEGAVQAAVVAWLKAADWTIERAADTQSREHGVDILGEARTATPRHRGRGLPAVDVRERREGGPAEEVASRGPGPYVLRHRRARRLGDARRHGWCGSRARPT